MRYPLLVAVTALLCWTSSAAQAQVYGDPNSLVDYWYRNYLGRPPDAGMTSWVTQLSQGAPPDQVLAGILASSEFYTKAGSSPQGYVTLLYQSVLGRSPNPGELDYWMRRMYTEDRQAVALAILDQNPGVWVSSGTAATPGVVSPPPVVITPRHDGDWHHDWDRDRRPDWDRYHNVYDYRRPDNYWHRDEHHDHHE